MFFLNKILRENARRKNPVKRPAQFVFWYKNCNLKFLNGQEDIWHIIIALFHSLLLSKINKTPKLTQESGQKFYCFIISSFQIIFTSLNFCIICEENKIIFLRAAAKEGGRGVKGRAIKEKNTFFSDGEVPTAIARYAWQCN